MGLLELLVPLGLGTAALMFEGVRTDLRRRRNNIVTLKQEAEQAQRQLQDHMTPRLPEGCLFVQQGPLDRPADLILPGTLMLVANGTPGVNRLLDILIALNRTGFADMVGSILVHECDELTRRQFAKAVPTVFEGRSEYAYAPEFPEGFGNLSPEEVENLVGDWGVPLLDAIKRVVKLHEERNGGKPGEIIVLTSLGGHVYPGMYLTQELHRRIPSAQVLGVINLPRQEMQREYFLTMKERYEQAGIAAWLISDQMERDWVTQDSVVGDLIAAITAASVGSDSKPRINNIVTRVAGYGVGGVARYQYIYGDIPAHIFQPNPDDPPHYYVKQEQAISELRAMIGRLECNQTDVSLAAPVGGDKRSTYDFAVAALSMGDMLGVRDQIEQAREIEDFQLSHKVRPHLHPQANYATIYTSWSQPINANEPRCRLLVVRLEAVRDGKHTVVELVKVPARRTSAEHVVPDAPLLKEAHNGVADESDKY